MADIIKAIMRKNIGDEDLFRMYEWLNTMMNILKDDEGEFPYVKFKENDIEIIACGVAPVKLAGWTEKDIYEYYCDRGGWDREYQMMYGVRMDFGFCYPYSSDDLEDESPLSAAQKTDATLKATFTHDEIVALRAYYVLQYSEHKF